MDYIYKITLTDGETIIRTKKVRTKEEGKFQAKEIFRNFKDAIKIEYYSKEGELNKRTSSKEEIIYNYILKMYADIYNKPLKRYPDISKEDVYKDTSKIINDIEEYLNIPYNGDRTSLEEGVAFIQQHIEDLRDELDYEKRKYEMDLYNAGIVDVMDTY